METWVYLSDFFTIAHLCDNLQWIYFLIQVADKFISTCKSYALKIYGTNELRAWKDLNRDRTEVLELKKKLCISVSLAYRARGV